LAVSAPADGFFNKHATLDNYYPKIYYGRVYIYYGVSGLGIAKNAQPDLIITTPTDTDDYLFNLGLGLRVSDCNGDGIPDLLVQSPLSQQGLD
jgi:hypothetical protein